MEGERRKVLVLDGETPAALAAARSLGRRGLAVDVGSTASAPVAGLSRFARTSILLPHPLRDRARFQASVLEQVARGRYALVMPVTERTAWALGEVRETLEADTRLAATGGEALAVTVSASALSAVANGCGVAMPPYWSVRRETDVERFASEFKYPALVAPDPRLVCVSSERGRELPASIVLEPRELRDRLAALLVWGPVTVQEVAHGRTVELGLLVGEGETLEAFQYGWRHELPSGGGKSSYHVSERLDPKLIEQASAVAKHLRLSGAMVARFRVPRQPGAAVLTQVTTDLSSLLPVAAAAGFDVGSHLFDLFVHKRRVFPQHYAVGVGRRDVAGEIEWLKAKVRRDGGVRWSGESPASRRTLGILWRRLHVAGQRGAGLASDPRPGLVAAGRLGRQLLDEAWSRAWRVLERGRMLRVRRRPQALIRRLQHARQVLVLCHGNVIRSPFAAQYFLSRLPKGLPLSVQSAGLGADDGGLAHPRAVARATGWGIDLNGHRTTRLTGQLVASADVVLVMEVDHIVSISRRFGRARGKTFLLSCLSPETPLEIADPIARDDVAFRVCFRHVALAVDAMVGVWTGATGLSARCRGRLSSSASAPISKCDPVPLGHGLPEPPVQRLRSAAPARSVGEADAAPTA